MLEDVIIACFLDNNDIVDYLDKLEVSDFSKEEDGKILAIMKDLKEQGVLIDYVTVANKMPFSELSISTLPSLTKYGGMFDTDHIEDYIRELKEESATRSARSILSDATSNLVFGADIKEAIKATTDKLSNIEFLDDNKLIDVGTISPDSYVNRVRIKSEFSNLDKMIGGFSLGELSIWTGKSRSTVNLPFCHNLC